MEVVMVDWEININCYIIRVSELGLLNEIAHIGMGMNFQYEHNIEGENWRERGNLYEQYVMRYLTLFEMRKFSWHINPNTIFYTFSPENCKWVRGDSRNFWWLFFSVFMLDFPSQWYEFAGWGWAEGLLTRWLGLLWMIVIVLLSCSVTYSFCAQLLVDELILQHILRFY